MNVLDVAEYILKKRASMSAMKLQKLVYYAQSWSLVWDERPLFAESFEAWANGPVCRALYDAHMGKERLLGIMDRGAFTILWWDPEHAACPSTYMDRRS